MTRTKTYSFLAGGFLALTVVSFCVFLQAADEPFVHFRQSEALVQVGVASVLAVFWFLFGASLCYLAFKQRISRWALLTLFLVALAIWIMVDCPLGYVADINHFVVGGR
jgi:hypothetical protein